MGLQTGSSLGGGGLQTGGATAVPVNTVAPALDNVSPSVNNTITTTNGTWTGSPTSYTYQWKRNGVSIGGSILNSYLIDSSEDYGAVLLCAVTAINAGGSTTQNSNATNAVTGIPVNQTPPAITSNGSNPAVPTNTLTVTSDGTWLAHPSPTYTYQWAKDSISIGGETNNTYVVQVGDIGGSIKCVVTATNSQGETPTDSNAIDIVA